MLASMVPTNLEGRAIASYIIKSMTLSINFFGSRTAVHAAAFNDHVECLQLLLRRAASADVPDSLGQTPLMMAAKHGHSNAVGEWGRSISVQLL
jgi:hypothetical protein